MPTGAILGPDIFVLFGVGLIAYMSPTIFGALLCFRPLSELAIVNLCLSWTLLGWFYCWYVVLRHLVDTW